METNSTFGSPQEKVLSRSQSATSLTSLEQLQGSMNSASISNSYFFKLIINNYNFVDLGLLPALSSIYRLSKLLRYNINLILCFYLF